MVRGDGGVRNRQKGKLPREGEAPGAWIKPGKKTMPKENKPWGRPRISARAG